MNKKSIQAVIFDVGGVFLKTHDHQYRHKWDILLDFPLNTVEETVFNSQMGRAAQHGEVTLEAHWAAVGRHFKLDSDKLAEMRRDFWAGDAFDYELIDWIRQTLRPHYKLGIISNAFDDLRAVLTDEFKVAELFDEIVISAEEGVMKPDQAIYTRTLERLEVEAEQAVFIDDSRKNIIGAEAVGIQTIHFTRGFDLPAYWRDNVS